MIDHPLVNKAIWTVEKAFSGAVDKGGYPYVSHLYRVAGRVTEMGPKVVAAALLHDIIEDHPGSWNMDRLSREFSPEVATIVEIVSRRPDENYKNFIERIATSGNVYAIKVKLADLADNMDPNRPSNVGGDRYPKARARLLKVL